MYAKARSQKAMSEKERAMRAQSEKSRKGQYLSGRYSNLADNLGRRAGGIIETEILRKPDDIRDDTKYMGQTEVLVRNVPLQTVSENAPVLEDSVREWILYGVSEEDPFSQTFFDEIQRLTEAIGDIEGKLKKIPKIVFADESGVPLPEEKAKEERNKLFDKYGSERTLVENALEEVDIQLKEHIAWRKTMGVNLVQGEVDMNSRVCTWHVTFSDAPDCQEIEDLLLLKENWAGIRLATSHVDLEDDTKRHPPWAGRGDPPDGSNITMPNYSRHHVNMLGATLSRVPRGVGLFQQLDRPSASIAGPEFKLFYGEYELGKYHGYGVETTDLGVYAGEFCEGRRQGKGRMDFADGTTVVGTFGLKEHNPMESKRSFSNPYTTADNHGWEPNGDVEIFYSDGGYFKGHMRHGVVEGHGDYQSAFDEILSGQFKDGRLHCERGFQQTIAGDLLQGRFVHGEQHGQGTCETLEGDYYEGTFHHGMKHGRGVYHTSGLQDPMLAGTYRGYYQYGFKHGRGSLEYGPKSHIHHQSLASKQQRKHKAPAGEGDSKAEGEHSSGSNTEARKAPESSDEMDEEDEHDHILSPFGHMYQGFFMANVIMNQGCVMNTTQQVPTIISRVDKRRNYDLTQVLRKEARSQKRAERELEKLQSIEMTLRGHLAEKKARIFHQQKHFTKKTMYDLDVYEEFNERELKHKLHAREDRLKKLTQEKHPYKRALIPRLRTMNNSMLTAYTKAYENIRPNPKEVKPEDFVPEEFIKLAMSNMEEARERQRLLKYDVLWQRAEDAFLDIKKGLLVAPGVSTK